MEEYKLKLFNTESREKEAVYPSNEQFIRMYTCGPTIYNFAHIGNFRTYVFEDLLRRSIKYFGFELEQVMNLTDVEDKTISGAKEKGVSLENFTTPYKIAFFEDLTTLNIERVENYPEATKYVEQMIEMIEELMKKGFAYKGADGSIYYSIKQFSTYGRLSHLKLNELKEGASDRISSDEYEKENASDFVLWKKYIPERDGDVFWESPFGRGRPGWHIECSAMATQLLGKSLDIHCGGVDNIFPHHENEIAQAEAFSGRRFVHIWCHAEHLIVNGKKMSKSLGNFYTLRDLLEKGYTGAQIRYLLLSTHYRTQLNFTFQGLDAASASLGRIQDFIHRLHTITGENSFGHTDPLLKEAHSNFKKALADDLNISVSLAALFDLIREINSLCDKKTIGKPEAEATLDLLKDFDRVLGVLPFQEEKTDFPQEVIKALDERTKARQEKNWQRADELREYIHSQGFEIEDSPSGPPRLKHL